MWAVVNCDRLGGNGIDVGYLEDTVPRAPAPPLIDDAAP
jgi:hypothetical protein